MKKYRLQRFKMLLALISFACMLWLPATAQAAEVEDYSATCYADTSKGLNVRKGPSTDEDVIGTLSNGTQITVTGKTSDGWYRIDYNGETGYVFAQYTAGLEEETTQAATESDTSSDTIAALKQELIGTPVLIILLIAIIAVVIAIIFTVHSFLVTPPQDEDEYDDTYEEDDED